ncbi:MAG: AgmX/PglI C-terminal domain-containing protein [Kofleriaceae bacterium]
MLALRTSLIWNGEVMDDQVFEKPAPVTIGATGKTTYVVPDLGLPPELAIVAPGTSGYLLTLGPAMRGTIYVDGAARSVEDFVQGDEPFFALPIAGRDWGVVDLDGTGAYQLFFQFVPRGEPSKRLVTRQMLGVGAIGFALLSLIGTVLWSLKGHDLGEAIVRSVGISTLALAAFGLGRGLLKQDGESQASLVFSLVLHAAILCFTVQIYSVDNAQAHSLIEPQYTGSYLARTDRVIEEIVRAPDTGKQRDPVITATPHAALPMPPHQQPPTWKPKKQTAAAPAADGVPHVGVLADAGILGTVVAGDTHGAIDKLDGLAGRPGGNGNNAFGNKHGTRGGRDGNGPVVDPTKTTETTKIPERAAVCVGSGCGGGGTEIVHTPPPTGPDDGPQLTPAEIDAVIHASSGLFRACYQKQVNLVGAGLAGTVVAKFRIAPEGKVKEAKVARSTIGNAAVGECVAQKLFLLRFPARGGFTTVTYPFVFSIGG